MTNFYEFFFCETTTIIIIIIIIICAVATILEASLQLTPGCCGGSPSPSYNHDIYLHFFCFIKPSTFDFVQISAYISYSDLLLVLLNIFLSATCSFILNHSAFKIFILWFLVSKNSSNVIWHHRHVDIKGMFLYLHFPLFLSIATPLLATNCALLGGYAASDGKKKTQCVTDQKSAVHYIAS